MGFITVEGAQTHYRLRNRTKPRDDRHGKVNIIRFFTALPGKIIINDGAIKRAASSANAHLVKVGVGKARVVRQTDNPAPRPRETRSGAIFDYLALASTRVIAVGIARAYLPVHVPDQVFDSSLDRHLPTNRLLFLFDTADVSSSRAPFYFALPVAIFEICQNIAFWHCRSLIC